MSSSTTFTIYLLFQHLIYHLSSHLCPLLFHPVFLFLSSSSHLVKSSTCVVSSYGTLQKSDSSSFFLLLLLAISPAVLLNLVKDMSPPTQCRSFSPLLLLLSLYTDSVWQYLLSPLTLPSYSFASSDGTLIHQTCQGVKILSSPVLLFSFAHGVSLPVLHPLLFPLLPVCLCETRYSNQSVTRCERRHMHTAQTLSTHIDPSFIQTNTHTVTKKNVSLHVSTLKIKKSRMLIISRDLTSRPKFCLWDFSLSV